MAIDQNPRLSDEENLAYLRSAMKSPDVERFCTALSIRNMTPEVHHEWAKYIKGHNVIPPINVFKDSLTEQMRTLRPGAEIQLKKSTKGKVLTLKHLKLQLQLQ